RRVLPARVERDRLLFRQAARRAKGREVGSVLSAIDGRNGDDLPGGRRVAGRRQPLEDLPADVGEAPARGVEVHEQRAIGGDGLAVARERPILGGAIGRAHAGVDGGGARVSELDRNRGVPDGQDARRTVQRSSACTATPACPSASRTARAFCTASGLSPWRQSVSARSGILVPSTASATPSRASCTARSATRAGSVITAPATLRATSVPSGLYARSGKASPA